MFEAGERISVKVEREDDDDWRADDPMGTSQGVEVKREPGVGRKRAGRKKLKLDLFKCDQLNCGYSTKIKGHFYKHASVHSDERPHKCHKCEKIFKTRDNLKHHLKSHSEETPFQCDECESAFKLKRSLTCHKFTHKNKEEWFKCEECDYSSPRKDLIKKHETTHVKTTPIKCQHCDYSCKSKPNLVRHFLAKHSSMEPWRCDQPDCQYTTRVKGNIKQHINTIHESKRRFKCDECRRAFKTKECLKRHSFVHSRIKPFKCQKCQYSSVEKRSLQVHEQRKHVDEKEHKCDECGASYRLKDDLEKHKLNHNDALKSFKCHLCPNKTRKIRNLKRHVQLRMNKGPCNCDYRTNNPRILRRSLRGEKCDQCGLALRDQSDSTMHRDAHRPCSVLLPSLPDSVDVISTFNAPPFVLRVKIELNDDVIKKEIV